MARAKPTHVIIHRIEMQEKEREYMETYLAGKTVQNVAVPIAIVGGVAGAGYLGYKALNAAYEWGDDIVDDLKREYTDAVEKSQAVASTTGTVLDKTPGPISNLFRVGKFLFT